MSTKGRTSRRDFLRTSAATTTALATLSVAAPSVLTAKSPNERIGVGFIGTGVRGGSLVDIVTGNDKREPGRRVCPAIEGVQAVAACDVYKPHLDKAIYRGNNADAKAYVDYRDLLADKNVDVVVIATPDHWHSKMLIDAANAGKDIYIEKGWTRTIPEVKAMHAAIKSTGVVMQLGHQGRQLAAPSEAGRIIKDGVLGPVTLVNTARCFNTSVKNPSYRWYGWYNEYRRPNPAQVIRDLDWKRWLGPAPEMPFNMEHFWHWRCYFPYGTGIAGDLLSHELDYVQSVLGYGVPDTCMTVGNIDLLKDGRECPDIWHSVFHFDKQGCTVTFESSMNATDRVKAIQFRGKEAALITNDIGHNASSFDVYPERQSDKYATAIKSKEMSPDKPLLSFDPTQAPEPPSHMQDFFDCVRSRKKPKCNEDQAFIEAVTFIMSYVSLREKRMVRWDREKEETVLDS